MHPHKQDLSRRQFVKRTALGAAAFSAVSSRVLGAKPGTSPNGKLNIAFIGVGGRGYADIRGLLSENMVALCDVDTRRANRTFEQFPKAKRYTDFRRMLDDLEKQIDAVVVATPDHTHAVPSMMAIERGKHVYCEKPLAHSIHEIRALMTAAKKHGVVTQLGNQGHSFDDIRRFCEWVWDGAIGNITEIHAGCSANHCKISQLPLLKEKHAIPLGLNWDLWLGPAQERPYHPVYLPGTWRGWMPFGSGTIGDWVCHVIDPVFWALDLGAPARIRAKADGYDPRRHADTFPPGTEIEYHFPAKGRRGPVKLIWFDGERFIPRPKELKPGDRHVRTGAVVIGDQGKIIYGSHGARAPRILPDEKMKAYHQPGPTLPRVKNHYVDWLNAIKNGGQAGSDFDYGGPLTEIAQLGIIATKLLGQELEWDSKKMRFSNPERANHFLNPPYRQGWRL